MLRQNQLTQGFGILRIAINLAVTIGSMVGDLLITIG